MNVEQHPDKSAFDKVWDSIVQTVELINESHPERVLEIREGAKDAIWETYRSFNAFCRKHYMDSEADRVDRHKVCACYMFAILKGGLINNQELESDSKKYLFDEKIAVTVGMTLLRAFTISAIDKSEHSVQEKQLLKERIENGIAFPKTNHGNYRTNFEIELYHTKTEENYNILSLSNTLYLLETITLGKDAINPVRKSWIDWEDLFRKIKTFIGLSNKN